MIDETTIRKAADMLLAAAPPGSKVILFGSYARGEADERSDLDFLVSFEPEASWDLLDLVDMKADLEQHYARPEIGRASCRERV